MVSPIATRCDCRPARISTHTRAQSGRLLTTPDRLRECRKRCVLNVCRFCTVQRQELGVRIEIEYGQLRSAAGVWIQRHNTEGPVLSTKKLLGLARSGNRAWYKSFHFARKSSARSDLIMAQTAPPKPAPKGDAAAAPSSRANISASWCADISVSIGHGSCSTRGPITERSLHRRR